MAGSPPSRPRGRSSCSPAHSRALVAGEDIAYNRHVRVPRQQRQEQLEGPGKAQAARDAEQKKGWHQDPAPPVASESTPSTGGERDARQVEGRYQSPTWALVTPKASRISAAPG